MDGQVHEVAPGVHRFSDSGANWYAVSSGETLVLVDCGWPRSGPAVVAGLAAIGHRPRDVGAILLTHGHPDHLGTADWMQRVQDVPVQAHERELPRVRGERPPTRGASLLLELWRPSAIGFVARSIERGVLSPRWPTGASALDPSGTGPLVPVATPGHTEGHTAYHLPEHGVLFTGDALVTRDVLTAQRGPRLHPAPFQVDIGRARESLAALAGLAADVLLPGHGDPHRGDVAAAVAMALER